MKLHRMIQPLSCMLITLSMTCILCGSQERVDIHDSQIYEYEKTPYDILNSDAPHKTTSHVISETSKQELEHVDLCKKLDRTITSFGSWGMEYLLQPKAEPTTIYTFQNSIKNLSNNKDALHRLQHLLYSIRESESYLLSYFEDNDELHQEIGNDLYFNKLLDYSPELNESITALEGSIHGMPLAEICAYIGFMLGPSISTEARTYFNRITGRPQNNESLYY